ncbi:MAG: glycosyltransferase, partial [Chitinophagaceae bacterium]
FKHGYSVNQPIVDQFKSMYNVNYAVIRNIAVLEDLNIPDKRERFILYQGAVNEGRSFETLIPAMVNVDARLIICGDGNFMTQARTLVKLHGLENKIVFKGKVRPDELKSYTLAAWIGITLFENRGLNNYYSLANRFFDYLHAAIPQICVDYPVYRDLNNPRPFAVLIDNLDAANIATNINRLLNDEVLYDKLQNNCMLVRQQLNWQKEEQTLLAFYRNLKLRLG